ncbi:hypothetical protein BU16DRAFT_557114 [Lophium mytilinum]|uniref:Uncharacterized protein n=1 Tax=Lophium mytilinum TaxID=390894 RepID=A0A6A6RB19_9PEZI|nr:hypothetical protein BU16DRAFT_557114 [Lophium mytilinum]
MAARSRKMSGTIEQSAAGPRQTVTHLWVSNVDGPVPVRDAVRYFFLAHYLYDSQGRPVEPVTFRPNSLTFRLVRNAQDTPPFNGQNGPNNAGPVNAPPPANAFEETDTTSDQAELLNRPTSNPSTAPTPSLTYSDSTLSTQPRRHAPPSQGSAVASDIAAVENNLPMNPTLADAFGNDETLFEDTPAMQGADGEFVTGPKYIMKKPTSPRRISTRSMLSVPAVVGVEAFGVGAQGDAEGLVVEDEEGVEAWVEVLIVEVEGDAEARALRSKKQIKGAPAALRGDSGNRG